MTYRLDERADGWLDLLDDDGQLRVPVVGRPPRRPGRTSLDGNRAPADVARLTRSRGTRCAAWPPTTAGCRVRRLRLIETVGDDLIETDLTPDRLGAVLADRFGVVLLPDDVAELARSRP